jgi:S-adenosylmethionine-diacylglycerol 3-amino-3-carboxypropyl transferase
MTLDATLEKSTGTLVKSAVLRNRFLSVDGFLERVFSFAFRGLVYPQIWEDPAVDLAAMEIEPHHHIVTIASGGCNVLSYLTASPAKITAVDLNRAHVALTKLKLAGLQKLPGWDAFYRFFGEADERQNIRDYKLFLQSSLDMETRSYWEGRGLTGSRRLKQFQKNIYKHGLLGRFIGVGHRLAKFYGRNLNEFLVCKTVQEQRSYFESEIAPLFQKRFVKWLTNQKVSLYGLGIPPAQYEALAGTSTMADVLYQRLEKLTCDFSLGDNYFAWQAFGRGYAPGASGSLPLYLQTKNFQHLRENAARVNVNQINMTAALRAMPAGSVDRIVLLDAQDWMTDKQLNDLWNAISHAATPRARVIFRTAGEPTILPGRVAEAVLNRWTYLEERSAKLGLQDRSSIYGGFHIYELAH